MGATIHHGGTTHALDFDAVASKRPLCTVEAKYCEGCSRQYFRPSDAARREPGEDKLCASCRATAKVLSPVEPKRCESCAKKFFRSMEPEPRLRDRMCERCMAKLKPLAARVQ